MTKLIIISILSLLASLQLSIQDDTCSPNSFKRFDETISKGTTFGNPLIKFPENQDQLVNWCRSSYKRMKEAEDFNKQCNKQLNKQVTALFVYTVRTVLKNYCKPTSKQALEFIEAAKCVNTVKDKEVQSYQKFIDDLLGAQQALDKNKIPHMCCGFYRTIDRYGKAIEQKCGERIADIQIKYANSLMANVIDLLAGEYTEDSDKCKTLGLPPKKLKTQRRTKSVALPVLELFKSFKEI